MASIIQEVRFSQSRPDRSTYRVQTTAFNQPDEAVLRMTATMPVLQRPGEQTRYQEPRSNT